ncbi:hypothetical protein KS083_25665, partial [Klebsiella pneumoniae subsp. ozaenae]|nr:hypothetical protein [Klebsiella pneumoniae subsp. ozaenae]
LVEYPVGTFCGAAIICAELAGREQLDRVSGQVQLKGQGCDSNVSFHAANVTGCEKRIQGTEFVTLFLKGKSGLGIIHQCNPF